jgi:APA family basic amino acid/polyamine antiporter
VTGTYVDREARKDKALSGAAKDRLLPDQFKRISKAGVPAFGIIGSASVASIAMIFNYLGSTGTTVLATPVLMTVHLREPVRLLRTCAAEMALDRPPRPPDTALGLRHGRRRHLPRVLGSVHLVLAQHRHSFWVYWAPFFLAGGALLPGILVCMAQRRHMTQPEPVPPYR